MLDRYKIRDWKYLLLRGRETIAEHRKISYYTSQSGDNIYIASPINENSLLNKTEAGVKYGSYYANELNECVKAGVKPKNISQDDWNAKIPSIIDAASKKP